MMNIFDAYRLLQAVMLEDRPIVNSINESIRKQRSRAELETRWNMYEVKQF